LHSSFPPSIINDLLLRVKKLTDEDVPYRIPRLDVVEPRPVEWPPVTLSIPTITLEEFLGALTGPVRPAVKAMFETWRTLPGWGIAPKAGNKKMGLWLADGTGRPIMVMDVDIPSGRCGSTEALFASTAPWLPRSTTLKSTKLKSGGFPPLHTAPSFPA
jgi:hypothetical protein